MGLFSSKSSSSTSNLNENIDQKLQMATGSVGATASGGGVVNINTSDRGAVDSSFEFANAVVDSTAHLVNSTVDSSLKFANAASDSSFKFGEAALNSNALITNGALGFAGAANDTNAKLINATVDSAFKAIEASNASNAAAMRETSNNAMMLANAATDSALKFGDSTLTKAFDFTKYITDGAAHDIAAAGSRADAITQSALSSVKEAYADTSATLADAYTNSKAGEQKVMVAAALAILGLVAIKMGGR